MQWSELWLVVAGGSAVHQIYSISIRHTIYIYICYDIFRNGRVTYTMSQWYCIRYSVKALTIIVNICWIWCRWEAPCLFLFPKLLRESYHYAPHKFGAQQHMGDMRLNCRDVAWQCVLLSVIDDLCSHHLAGHMAMNNDDKLFHPQSENNRWLFAKADLLTCVMASGPRSLVDTAVGGSGNFMNTFCWPVWYYVCGAKHRLPNKPHNCRLIILTYLYKWYLTAVSWINRVFDRACNYRFERSTVHLPQIWSLNLKKSKGMRDFA